MASFRHESWMIPTKEVSVLLCYHNQLPNHPRPLNYHGIKYENSFTAFRHRLDLGPKILRHPPNNSQEFRRPFWHAEFSVKFITFRVLSAPQ